MSIKSHIPGFLRLACLEESDGIATVRASSIVLIRGTWDGNDTCTGSRVTFDNGLTFAFADFPNDIEDALA